MDEYQHAMRNEELSSELAFLYEQYDELYAALLSALGGLRSVVAIAQYCNECPSFEAANASIIQIGDPVRFSLAAFDPDRMPRKPPSAKWFYNSGQCTGYMKQLETPKNKDQ